MQHELVMERVRKARATLILERKFYGVLVSNVEPVISTALPTAGTNGKQHIWNPDYVNTLTQPELIGVQAHESEHDARHHGTRRGNRDALEWNIACDYAINGDLLAEGFTLPKERLHDPKYKGMSAEDIYRVRELEKRREQEQAKQDMDPGKPEMDDDESDEPEADDMDPGTEQGGEPEQEAEAEQGDEQGDKPGDHPGNGEADDDAGDEQGDEPGKAAGEGTGEGEGEAEGEGTPGDGEPTGEAGKGAGEGENGEEGEVGKEKGKQASGDVGRCGEVLDAADDATESAEADLKWDRVVRQAASMAKAAGQLPGHVTREIERANNPPRDWRDELRDFCEQGALRIETWNRPNRRFVGRGLVLPGSQRDGVSKAAFLIDTSGSCDDIALACVRDEAQQLLDDGIIDEIVVVYGDTRVCRVDEYRTGDEIEFDPRGGGGTDMQPLFQHVADEISDATLIINFTDLEFYKDCGEEPACPVLFAVHGHPSRVKQLMQSAPWAARCIDVGVH